VLAVAYAPDGATLVTGGDDGTVRIWDARTGQQQHQLTGHTGESAVGTADHYLSPRMDSSTEGGPHARAAKISPRAAYLRPPARMPLNVAERRSERPPVAEWAGHGVDVLLKIYAKCIDGQDGIAKRRIEEALRDGAGGEADSRDAEPPGCDLEAQDSRAD